MYLCTRATRTDNFTTIILIKNNKKFQNILASIVRDPKNQANSFKI